MKNLVIISKRVHLFYKLQKQYRSKFNYIYLLKLLNMQIYKEKFTNLPVFRFIFFIFFSLDSDLFSELNLNLEPDNRLNT